MANKNTEESPLVKGLREYFENTPPEQLDQEFKELEVYNQIGPDAHEYIEQVMNELNGISAETSESNEDN